eukprot:Colp12_sorted_trinity150504_noHs@14511
MAIGDLPVFSRLAGKWNGDLIHLDDARIDPKCVCTTKITVEGESFTERRTVTDNKGITTTHFMKITPKAHGVAVVTSDSKAFENASVELKEGPHDTVTLYFVNQSTGKLQAIETITVRSDQEYTRVVQQFSDGKSAVSCSHVRRIE